MINVYSNELNIAISFASNDRVLTNEEKVSLLAELTDDPMGLGYAQLIGQGNFQSLVAKLAQPFTINNPNPREMVPKFIWGRTELYDKLLETMSGDGLPFFLSLKIESLHENPERAMNAQMVELTLNSPLPFIDFNHPMIEDSINILIENDILTEESYQELTEELDPTWTSTLNMVSRLEAIGFGTGAVVSIKDIQDVLNG